MDARTKQNLTNLLEGPVKQLYTKLYEDFKAKENLKDVQHAFRIELRSNGYREERLMVSMGLRLGDKDFHANWDVPVVMFIQHWEALIKEHYTKFLSTCAFKLKPREALYNENGLKIIMTYKDAPAAYHEMGKEWKNCIGPGRRDHVLLEVFHNDFKILVTQVNNYNLDSGLFAFISNFWSSAHGPSNQGVYAAKWFTKEPSNKTLFEFKLYEAMPQLYNLVKNKCIEIDSKEDRYAYTENTLSELLGQVNNELRQREGLIVTGTLNPYPTADFINILPAADVPIPQPEPTLRERLAEYQVRQEQRAQEINELENQLDRLLRHFRPNNEG